MSAVITIFQASLMDFLSGKLMIFSGKPDGQTNLFKNIKNTKIFKNIQNVENAEISMCLLRAC